MSHRENNLRVLMEAAPRRRPGRPARRPGTLKYFFGVILTPEEVAYHSAQASSRGIALTTWVTKLLETVAKDDLARAVVDE